MATQFHHDTESKRYTMTVGGELVSVLEYRDHGASVVMHHTVTIPKYRGRGFAASLVAHAVDDVAASGRTISPTCWFVAEWFDRHPERADLLAS
ncbi:MAG: GNAT family N-acetyltransferase [Microbacteriaceae bacterium]